VNVLNWSLFGGWVVVDFGWSNSNEGFIFFIFGRVMLLGANVFLPHLNLVNNSISLVLLRHQNKPNASTI
jgi:hypothetical protein